MFFRWIFFAHQIGTALASYVGGAFCELTGLGDWIFISAGILGVIAAEMVPAIQEPSRRTPASSPAQALPATGG
jgi:predicted MFS family arabinose efflux permease